MQHEMQLYENLFREFRRLVQGFQSVWQRQNRPDWEYICPDSDPQKDSLSPEQLEKRTSFDRIAYWKRTGGPMVQLLSAWKKGNEQWPVGQNCTAEIVEKATEAIRKEID